jgi:phosphinothricin tripeptide acetyl hydrolase
MGERGIDRVRAHLTRLPPADSLTIEQRRAQYDKAERAFPAPPEVSVARISAPAAPAEWLTPPSARADAVLLYLHGGGYVVGSPRSHRHLAAAIAAAAGTSGLLLDYRLAPEHPFPAAVDDAVAAYRWILDGGVEPARVAIAGDSAGGGLTLATLLAVRDGGLPPPAAAACISPWVDLTCSSGSYAEKAASDPIVRQPGISQMAGLYLGGADPRTPLASPLFADLAGLPPLLVQVGSEEMLLDDAVGLADRARAAGVETALEVWPDMIHVWHWFLPMLDEARAAVEGIAAFIRKRIA